MDHDSATYSQYGEDLILAKLFPDLSEYRNLIDVGAYEPEAMSNSRLFIERGWDATLIEFTPHPLRNLVKAYGDNPRVRVIGAALTVCDQGVQKFRLTDDAISSADPNVEERFKDMRPGYHGGFFGDLWVPTLSIGKLLDQFYCDKPIHFVNIDTEGTSVDLAIDFMKLLGGWKPQVICVEHDNRLVELVGRGQEFGYRLHHANGCNAILRCQMEA